MPENAQGRSEGETAGYLRGQYSRTGHCEQLLTTEVLELGLDVMDVQIQRQFVGFGNTNGRKMELYG